MPKLSSILMRGSFAHNAKIKSVQEVDKITKTFYAKADEYRFPNGRTITAGTPLRQLENGMIMTGHLSSNKTSRVVVPRMTDRLKKTMGIGTNGRTMTSKQVPADAVIRQRTKDNMNEKS